MIESRKPMVIKKPVDIPSSEITNESDYLNRRNFMRAGIVAASVLATGYLYKTLNKAGSKRTIETRQIPGLEIHPTTAPSDADPMIVKAFHVDEPQTPLERVTHYNNFYE